MKKIIGLLMFVGLVFGSMGAVQSVHAQAVPVTNEELVAQYQSLLQQLIALLIEQVHVLQAQLALQIAQNNATTTPPIIYVLPQPTPGSSGGGAITPQPTPVPTPTPAKTVEWRYCAIRVNASTNERDRSDDYQFFVGEGASTSTEPWNALGNRIFYPNHAYWFDNCETRVTQTYPPYLLIPNNRYYLPQ